MSVKVLPHWKEKKSVKVSPHWKENKTVKTSLLWKENEFVNVSPLRKESNCARSSPKWKEKESVKVSSYWKEKTCEKVSQHNLSNSPHGPHRASLASGWWCAYSLKNVPSEFQCLSLKKTRNRLSRVSLVSRRHWHPLWDQDYCVCQRLRDFLSGQRRAREGKAGEKNKRGRKLRQIDRQTDK